MSLAGRIWVWLNRRGEEKTEGKKKGTVRCCGRRLCKRELQRCGGRGSGARALRRQKATVLEPAEVIHGATFGAQCGGEGRFRPDRKDGRPAPAERAGRARTTSQRFYRAHAPAVHQAVLAGRRAAPARHRQDARQPPQAGQSAGKRHASRVVPRPRQRQRRRAAGRVLRRLPRRRGRQVPRSSGGRRTGTISGSSSRRNGGRTSPT
jgi:hypothetical protein